MSGPNSTTINRRSNFLRSQTTTSGMVPLEGDKPQRSNSASSSSSLISATSVGPMPNVIRVQSIGSSVDSGLQLNPTDEKDIHKMAEFLEICDEIITIDTTLLCKRQVRHVINVSKDALKIEKRAYCECNLERGHMPEVLNIPLDHISTPQQIVSYFSAANKFICDAREKNSRIMIYSPKLRRSLGCVIGIEYLMTYYNLRVERAMDHYQKVYQNVHGISDICMEALKLWRDDLDNLQKLRKGFAERRQNSEDSRVSLQSRFQNFVISNLRCSENDEADTSDNDDN
ncbi:unnamed protein product [Caenorhabditis angaria]|uniref:Dual specificity phosphatase catalytic domain-containing protein n=1 Tax=Caenorhabditis angaria TaxID=860376 RepID=A0A9P1IDN9_9PELO|nr:unnamed protein product [Caenorhabditis angaria]